MSRLLARWLARLSWGALMAVALTACGGGGSPKAAAGTPSTGADATHGAFTLGLSGGATRDVTHVWVTIGSVALHPQASQPWSASDRSWTVLRLTTPVVVDLAVVPSSSQGDVTRVLSGLSVPAGTYGQIRVFPLAHDAALDDAAVAKGLRYNAQVNYTDDGGQARVVPLELPAPELGWRMGGDLTVAANEASYLVIQADLQHSLVRLASSDGLDRFTFRPALQRYDMALSGAIIGYIDPSLICGGSGAPAAPQCADDIIISAQRLSDDGQRHVSVRQYRIGSGGGFALYPLPSDTRYDVVITGRRMQTMLVRDVTVSPFSAVSTLDWTVLGASSTPIRPVIVPAAARRVNLASALSPASSQLYVGQTWGSGVPHQVAVANVDAFSGVLARDLDLPEGPASVAIFTSSEAALNFVNVDAQPSPQAVGVMARGTAYDEPGAVAVSTPAAGVRSLLAVDSPVRQASLGMGQLQVTISGALSATYDAAQLVVADVNGIVATRAVSGAGAQTLTLPAGSQAAGLGGTAVYAVAVRATSQSGALKWVRAASVVDLRNAAGATVTLALP